MGKHWSWSVVLVAACTPWTLAKDESPFTKASNDSLLWGPYKSNLYFGVRPRIPKSMFTSLSWTRVDDYVAAQRNLRSTCEQHEGMDGYGWDSYDPRTGGVQVIHDKGNGLDVHTSFVKFDGGKGGWGARIKGVPREDEGSVDMKTAVWFSISVEGLGGVEARNAESAEEYGYDGEVVFDGELSELGEFSLTVTDPKENTRPLSNHPSYDLKPLDRTWVHSLQVPEEALWQNKALILSSMKDTVDTYVAEYDKENLPPPWQTYTITNSPGTGNFHLVEKVFEGEFEFDVLYSPASADKPATSADLTKALAAATTSFDRKYLDVFKPQAPFTDKKYLGFSKSLFSNLIGGIGYFHGDQVIDRSYASEYEEENEGFWREAEEARSRNQHQLEGPYELFTAVPSRPFFPRGFLWDEGFHLLPILEWDSELTMQIISSWFNTMDEDGWIAREQILGNEARSKVPTEFQIQYPHYANPPTLFMALEALLNNVEAKKTVEAAVLTAWLKQLYPLLQRNFEWYRRTQWGDFKSYDREAFSSKEGYRWRGRTPRHILTSGLDDYPRAQPPHPGELHVDLISWIGMMTRNMQRIAKYLGESDDVTKYARISEAIGRNVDDLHWSKKDKTYCDSTIDDYEESVHVCHKGYISIFPFMTGLIGPEHPHLKDVLDLISDPEHLWSPYGIRSLSKSDELYGTDENYWRSPIWMPMNYLVVNELLNIASTKGPQQAKAKKIYGDLRKNLINTVYKSWLESGFAWEQYNPETGEGQRTQHFTGWTSLVVKIMAMPEAASVQTGHEEL